MASSRVTIVDVLFLIDLWVNFRTGFYDPNEPLQVRCAVAATCGDPLTAGAPAARDRSRASGAALPVPLVRGGRRVHGALGRRHGPCGAARRGVLGALAAAGAPAAPVSHAGHPCEHQPAAAGQFQVPVAVRHCEGASWSPATPSPSSRGARQCSWRLRRRLSRSCLPPSSSSRTGAPVPGSCSLEATRALTPRRAGLQTTRCTRSPHRRSISCACRCVRRPRDAG